MSYFLLRGLIFAILALWAGGAKASTPILAQADLNVLSLAQAIQARAERSSPADLDKFAMTASRMPGREGLRRLEFASLVFNNQSEFDHFHKLNALLARNAAAQHDVRFQHIAAMDALKSRYDEGDSTTLNALDRMIARETDWFARLHGSVFKALALVLQLQISRISDSLRGVEGISCLSLRGQDRCWLGRRSLRY